MRKVTFRMEVGIFQMLHNLTQEVTVLVIVSRSCCWNIKREQLTSEEGAKEGLCVLLLGGSTFPPPTFLSGDTGLFA